MSRQIQIRRGTVAEHKNFTGAIGEVTMDTTNNTLRVHDGATAGGFAMARSDQVINDLANVPEVQARQLIGNRIWFSGDYDFSTVAPVIISHNLNLSRPEHAFCTVYLRVKNAVRGYAVGDIISCFQAVCWGYNPDTGGHMVNVAMPTFMNVAANTVMVPPISAAYMPAQIRLYDIANNTWQDGTEAENFTFFVKIMY